MTNPSKHIAGHLTVGLLLLSPVPSAAVIGGSLVSPQSDTGRSILVFTGIGGTICSSVLIGPQVIMTAGTCVGPGESAVTINARDRVSATCTRMPNAEAAPEFDIALCAVQAPIPNLIPRTVSSVSPRTGTNVIIAGFGCRQPGGTDRSFGSAVAGETRIVVAPPAEPLIRTEAGAVGCFGDSGGPGLTRGATGLEVVGIVVRTDLREATYLAPMSNIHTSRWMRQWSDAYSQPICGLTTPQPCDSGTPVDASPTIPVVVARPPAIAPPNATSVIDSQTVRADAGDTIERLYGRICGLGDIDVANILQSRFPENTPNRTLAAGEIVSLPVCPATPPSTPTPPMIVAATVGRGESVWNLWQRARATGSTTLLPAEFARQVGEINQINPARIQPGEIRVPVSPVATPRRSDPQAATLAPGAEAILSLSADESGCTGPADSSVYPFDVDMVLDVMRMNRRSRAPAARATILIADSGIEATDRGVFAREIFVDAPSPWGNFARSMRPIINSIAARRHGLEVASLALGGPILSYYNIGNTEPRLNIVIRPIYQELDGRIVHDTNLFPDIIRQARTRTSTIVNLSLRSSARIPSIMEETQRGERSILFVAAAGNQGRPLGSGGDPLEAVYPALYGGNENRRLITVAALDGLGQLAPFSNHSPTYVDIAAPGCQIPTFSYIDEPTRLRVVPRSGTSLAAPLVTFAAAIIFSETGFSAEEIKRRVVAASDVSRELSDRVVDGRRLNIAKAIAVNDDVFEAQNIGPRFGRVEFLQNGSVAADDHRLVLACTVQRQLILPLGQIRKIARFGERGGAPNFLLYYVNEETDVGGSLFRRDECSAPDGWSVRLTASDRPPVGPLRFDEMTDYVRRLR